MAYENYYELFDIKKDANLNEIKKSYKKLAVKWHPDKNQNSEIAKEMFSKVVEAYKILCDPEKRKIYDIRNFHKINLNKKWDGISKVSVQTPVKYDSILDEFFDFIKKDVPKSDDILTEHNKSNHAVEEYNILHLLKENNKSVDMSKEYNILNLPEENIKFDVQKEDNKLVEMSKENVKLVEMSKENVKLDDVKKQHHKLDSLNEDKILNVPREHNMLDKLFEKHLGYTDISSVNTLDYLFEKNII
jgi:curved DNA-binding protein CbpA